MNRPYYICYHEKTTGKNMFSAGDENNTFYSDFQSARGYSKREAEIALGQLKRRFRGDYKRLKTLKILPVEVEL